MRRKFTQSLSFLAILTLSVSHTAWAQLETLPLQIIDTGSKSMHSSTTHQRSGVERRTQSGPTECTIDTVEYARFKATGQLQVVTMYEGRGLGQFYGAPQEITLHGASFYAFITGNPSVITTQVYVNVYRADADSLPSGAPLRSDTVTIDTTFGGGIIANIIKHAQFEPLTLDFDYIVAVESAPSDTLRVALVANDWNQNNGRGDFFNCGSIQGIWYRGRNLNINNAVFDSDMLINPHVSYRINSDFDIVSQCFSPGDTVQFINKNHANSVFSSPFYNRHAFNNQEQFSYRWNYGINAFQATAAIDGQNMYTQSQEYEVRLSSMLLQWNIPTRFCRDTVTHTLFPKPIRPTLSGGGIRCMNDSALLIATNPLQDSVSWFTRITDSLPIATGDSFLALGLTQDTFFYARISNGMCTSDPGTVGMQVFSYPAPPTTRNDSICAGSRALLSAFAPDALSVIWYRDSSENFPVSTGNVLQTGILQTDTFLFARAANFSCFSEGWIRASVLVSNDFAPGAPDVEGDTLVCLGTSPTVTLRAQYNGPETVRWFQVPSGGSPIATGNTLTLNPTQRGNFEYYAETWNGICGSSRMPVQVQTDEAPPLLNAEGSVVCLGLNAEANASVAYGAIRWFDQATAGNLLEEGPNILVERPQQSLTLYVERFSGQCIAPVRTPVLITVNAAPEFTFISSDTLCSRSAATLRAGSPEGGILWFEDPNDPISISSGNTFTTPILLGNRSYYVATILNGCMGNKQEVSVRVNPRPFSGFFYDVMTDQRIQLTPLTTSGATYNWNFGDGNSSNETAPIHRYHNYGTYPVRLILTSTTNGCRDTTTNSIELTDPNISVPTLPTQIQEQISFFPNPISGQFVIQTPGDWPQQVCEIYTLNGKKVADLILQRNTETHLLERPAHLAAGIYFMKIGTYAAKIQFE